MPRHTPNAQGLRTGTTAIQLPKGVQLVVEMENGINETFAAITTKCENIGHFLSRTLWQNMAEKPQFEANFVNAAKEYKSKTKSSNKTEFYENLLGVVGDVESLKGLKAQLEVIEEKIGKNTLKEVEGKTSREEVEEVFGAKNKELINDIMDRKEIQKKLQEGTKTVRATVPENLFVTMMDKTEDVQVFLEKKTHMMDDIKKARKITNKTTNLGQNAKIVENKDLPKDKYSAIITRDSIAAEIVKELRGSISEKRKAKLEKAIGDVIELLNRQPTNRMYAIGIEYENTILNVIRTVHDRTPVGVKVAVPVAAAATGAGYFGAFDGLQKNLPWGQQTEVVQQQQTSSDTANANNTINLDTNNLSNNNLPPVINETDSTNNDKPIVDTDTDTNNTKVIIVDNKDEKKDKKEKVANTPIGDKNYNAGSNALVDRQMEKENDNAAIVDFMSDFAIAIKKNPNDQDLQLTARLIFFYMYRNRGFEKDGKIAGPEFLKLICPSCNGDLDTFKTDMETIDYSGTEIVLAGV